VFKSTRQQKETTMKTKKVSERKVSNLSTFILSHGLRLGTDFTWDAENQVFEIATAFDPKTGIVDFEKVEPTLTAVRAELGY
jgi:hypothetical protein